VLACPFGVPKYYAEIDQMMKCDMCYDRTSTGKRPMCATVCPSQALAFTTLEEIGRTRQGVPVNEWHFGTEPVKTKVYVMVPREIKSVDIGLVQIETSSSTIKSDSFDQYDVASILQSC
jgi:Fe-S-cluster-containing dehydrogenase component